MLNFLYTIFIYPVYMFVDFMLFVAEMLSRGNIGVSIVILSVGVNLICLPLYNMAEKLQEKERGVQAGMKSMVSRIKAAFKGDEQYMMLSDVIGGCFGFANSASGGAHVGFENVFTAKLGPVFKF